MSIALYWRALIGDSEYVKFDPEDLLRWYEALKLRGHDEIRNLRNERYRTAQTGGMQGIVSGAPHPPIWLVNQWLEKEDQKVHTLEYWGMTCAFVVVSFLVFGNLQGCMSLKPMNPLWMKPPADGLTAAGYTAPPTFELGVAKQGMETKGPNTVAGPASFAATGATSNGVAGAPSASAPPTGATGPRNIGASGGAVQGNGSSQ
jgi:hypothetical protein